MSVIVAVSDGKKIVMGGDSVGTFKDEMAHVVEPKIARIGDMLVGTCGTAKACHLVRMRMEWPTYDGDLTAWRIQVEDVMTDVLEEAGLRYDCEDAKARRVRLQTLVGVGGHLVCFDELTTSHLEPPYVAIGRGRRPAFGALFAAREIGVSAHDQVRLALHAAAMNCNMAGPPFHIFTNEDDEFVTIANQQPVPLVESWDAQPQA